MSHQILVNAQLLDTFEGEDLNLQIESNVMKSLEDYTSSYSYTYRLPMTSRNLTILNLTDVVDALSPANRKPVKYHNVEYLQNDVRIFEGDMYIESYNLTERVFNVNFLFGRNKTLKYWADYKVQPCQIINKVELWEQTRDKGDKFTGKDSWYCQDYQGIKSTSITDQTCPYYLKSQPFLKMGDVACTQGMLRTKSFSADMMSFYTLNWAGSEVGVQKTTHAVFHQSYLRWSMNIHSIMKMIEERWDIKWDFTDRQKEILDKVYYQTNRLAKKGYQEASFYATATFINNPKVGIIVNTIPSAGILENGTTWGNFHLFSGDTNHLVTDYNVENLPVQIVGSYQYPAYYCNRGNKFNVTKIKVSIPQVTLQAGARIYMLSHYTQTESGVWQYPDGASESLIDWYPISPVLTGNSVDFEVYLADTDLPEESYKHIWMLPTVKIFPVDVAKPISKDAIRVTYGFYYDGDNQVNNDPLQEPNDIGKLLPETLTDGNGGSWLGNYNQYDCLPNKTELMPWLSDIMFSTCGAFPININLENGNRVCWRSLDEIYEEKMEDWSNFLIDTSIEVNYTLDDVDGNFATFQRNYFIHNNSLIGQKSNIFNTSLVTRIDQKNELLDLSGTAYEAKIEYSYPNRVYPANIAGKTCTSIDRLVQLAEPSYTRGYVIMTDPKQDHWRTFAYGATYAVKDGAEYLNNLSKENFPVFWQVFEEPMVVTANFALPLTVMSNLNLTHPVYLSQFGEKFAVISINAQMLNDTYVDAEVKLLRLKK